MEVCFRNFSTRSNSSLVNTFIRPVGVSFPSLSCTYSIPNVVGPTTKYTVQERSKKDVANEKRKPASYLDLWWSSSQSEYNWK